jgi:chromosome segregation protein
MTYVKKLVMHGFKSFANRTEVLFEKDMNVIVGPNGCGKSNIADALCFVLGRLSIKSIRAAKAANLLFSGTQKHKPAYEAFVEIIFDNSQNTFPVQNSEISIKRILRKNGQSIYRINGETKTRQDLLELLAQAGIDPYGFNIVLQGEIAALIKMNAEERRKIIEEVAGISIYESRKQKSIHELEKTEEKLKEVAAVLREKRNYLSQLERDRQEAQKYQKYEEQVKRGKATIFQKNIKGKEGEIVAINEEIDARREEMDDFRKRIIELNKEVEEISIKVKQIDKIIESSTNKEQEVLHEEIANLRAEIASLEVRRDNFSLRLKLSIEKKANYEQKVLELEQELKQMKGNSPEIKKQQEKLKEYQKKSEDLEKKRRRFYSLKGEIFSLENRKEERQKDIIEYKKELELIERQINQIFEEIKFEKSLEKSSNLKEKTKDDIENLEKEIRELEKEILSFEKERAVFENELQTQESLKKDIVKLDICPLCKSKITKDHIDHVIEDANSKINLEVKRNKEIEDKKEKIFQILENKKKKFSEMQTKLRELEFDKMKLVTSEQKKEEIKKILEEQKENERELKEINDKLSVLKKEFESIRNVETEYDEEKMKIQDISFADLDVDAEITVKQKDLNRLNLDIKNLVRDIEESEQEFKIYNEKLEISQKAFEKKEKEEEQLYEKFQKFFNEKNVLQDKQKVLETQVIGFEHQIRAKQEKINDLNVSKARINAEIESLRFEFKEFESYEVFSCSIEEAKRKVEEAQQRMIQIGNVNMRALEVYDQVKEQVVLIEGKVETINKEKEDIMKIIEEIDKKKKKSFIVTLEKVNELFTRNFSQLSRKGEVFLELENKEDPFTAGLNILVKVAKGKYFDINSLSGGEKTMVALSLIFAIQEYKPYHFYIFDEIDAALDKRNSELLAALVKKYMLSGQYVIITHNDAIISEASTLYGVSMQESISKILSLKV